MNSIERFFLFCAGINGPMLKKCPTDVPKYFGIGATIFFTGVFAFISSGYAIYTVFKSVWIAVAFGIIWGLMIFNLDRYIVGSIKKRDSFWRDFRTAVPRIILAIILALVISKPLELKIFEPEILAELIIMEQKLYKEQEQTVKARFTQQKKTAQDEINLLKKDIMLHQSRRDTLLKYAQQEADGTGGSRRRNLGPIYKIKKAEADKASRDLDSIKAHHQELITARQKELSDADSLIVAEVKGFGRQRYDGMAARMDALSHLTASSSAIYWANWFIILLFITIETAPIFVKLISDRSPYDNLLMLHEHHYELFRMEKTTKLNYETNERIKDFVGKELKMTD
jgi:hypothetical protein